MKEKKSVKISLGTIICIVIIFLLLCVIGSMWYYNSYERENNTEINEASAKIDKITYNKRYESPKFYYGDLTKDGYENMENWENEAFVFSESGNVTYYAYESSFMGKYELLDNGIIKVNIDHYTSEPGAIYNEPIEYKTELKILDANTLIGKTMDIASNENDISFEYASPYQVVYSINNY